MRFNPRRVPGRLASVSALALTLAFGNLLGGCAGKLTDITGSLSSRKPETPQERLDAFAAQYRQQPHNPDIAVAYARALRESGQRAQAVAVLQQASILTPKNEAVLAEYGRALAAAGRYQQALDILARAHTPDKPDWRILNAQGAVLDQIGNHAEARRYYETALRIAPDQPSILSNLGLSYALAKDLVRAEATLRRATARPGAEPRVRQNLALVLGLQGKFEEAEKLVAGDLPPDEARANVAYLREMVKQHAPLKSPAKQKKPARG
jgi:Flp pilus assembly protein TadD